MKVFDVRVWPEGVSCYRQRFFTPGRRNSIRGPLLAEMDHGEETEVSVVTSSDTEDTDGQSESDDLLSVSKTVGFNLQTQTSFFEVKAVQ